MRALQLIALLVLIVACRPSEKPRFADEASLQLSSPKVIVDSVIFVESAKIKSYLDYAGAQVRYNLDDREVVSSDQLVEDAIDLKESGVVRLRAFHPVLKNSDEVRVTVRKATAIAVSEVRIAPDPHQNYPGEGAKGLVDLKKGKLAFRGDSRWMGFQTPEVKIDLQMQEETSLSSITLSYLQDHGGWIFDPESISVEINGKLISQTSIPVPTQPDWANLKFATIDLGQSIRTDRLTIRIKNLDQIPEWHQGKGTAPWLFIDEILFD